MACLTDLNGLPLTCKSSDAVELYNKVLESFCSLNEGFMNELESAIKLDPGFVMARCLMTGFKVEAYSTSSPEIVSDMRFYDEIYNSVTVRERMHIDAIKTFANKNSPNACDLWDKITVEYPLDVQATRWVFGVCLEIGEFNRMRDVMTRVLHYYPKTTPIYPHILSMYAFSMEETDSRDEAEKACIESIGMQPRNPWGIHAMSHVIEEERPTEKGVEFLKSCRINWEKSILCHHIAWHLMLYYLDLNQIDNLFSEYDSSLSPKISADNAFALLDASSLLWRLNILGIDVGNRWEKVTECFKPRMNNSPQLTWLECHLMFSLCHGNLNESTARLALAHQLLKSMEQYSLQETSYDCSVAKILGVPLCNGLIAYGQGNYSDAFSAIVPVKYDIIKLGGSWAQRQVFYITMIQAAIQSKEYKKAMARILELKAKKPHSQLLSRLYDQVAAEMQLSNAGNSSPSPKRSKTE